MMDLTMLMNFITSPIFFGMIIFIAVWDGVWKLIAMWRACKNDSIVWYIVLAVLNTAGILPILYIYVFSKKAE